MQDSRPQDSSTNGSARSTPTAETFSRSGGPKQTSTRTCEHLACHLPLTSSLRDFPAPTSVSLASVPALAGQKAAYGLKQPESFANYDPSSSSWRTFLVSSSEESTEFSGIWPQAGMTRSGTAIRLRPSAPRMYERESGLLPTPLASETGWRKKPYSQGGKALSTTLGGRPNPPYVEWMMGVPIGWTDCELSETASSLLSRNTSDE